MNIAACYTVFNGLELLQGSIHQIVDHVDKILICYQVESNTGTIDKTVPEQLENLDGKGKIELIKFEPDTFLLTKRNELNKHNQMVDHLKGIGISHFVLMACDHYYESNQFRRAVKLAIYGNFDVTFSEMYTYYKKPNWRLDPIEDYMMPFVIKVQRDTRFRFSMEYPQRVDPSLKAFPIDATYTFTKNELMMHHFSMIRVDVNNKFKNAAASVNWSPERIQQFIKEYDSAQVGDRISYFKNRKIIEVEQVLQIKFVY